MTLFIHEFIFLDQLLDLHQGQGMDIWFRDNFTCPTEDEYKTLVIKSNKIIFFLKIKKIFLFILKKLEAFLA